MNPEDRFWEDLSHAAKQLRHTEAPGPQLWSRIREELAAEVRAEEQRRHPGPVTRFAAWFNAWSVGMRAAMATAAVLAIMLPTVWLVRRANAEDPAFLTEQALKEVQASEQQYVQSIEKLSRLAEPVFAQSPSPVVAGYREKVMLLDSAIAQLREEAERNRWNAYLRTELVSLYRDKQQTLTEVLKYAKSDVN